MPDTLTASSKTLHRVLDLVASEEGLSMARACKRLSMSRSELQRLLTQLGSDESLGGLDLIRIEAGQGRDTLWLTKRARAAGTAP